MSSTRPTGTAHFDPELVRRYDRPGPRYTSYPTAPHFRTDFDEASYRRALLESNGSGRPLSLYVHIPFCEHLCFYCACTKVLTRHREWGTDYVRRLEREMALVRRSLEDRPVVQLHFGGGTPTFLEAADLTRLMAAIRRHFPLLADDEGEYGIEIDPRTVEPEGVAFLRSLGFNRLSLGVQDFDPEVQQAVHRIQSPELVATLLARARSLGFRSLSLDLIYGLPRQTPESFATTLATVVALRPDRLALFNYAHLPELFPAQRRLSAAELPPPEAKLEILSTSIAALENAGYVHIGMDHFALPADDLVRAQATGTLHRNFQGYTTHGEADLVGFGMSAIGSIGDVYSQNRKDLEAWNAALDAGKLPVERGLRLDAEDKLRRHIITRLICDFRLDTETLARLSGIDFEEHFADSRPALETLRTDGLIEWDGPILRVTDRGRFLVRHVCMVFDAYLAETRARYSRVI